MKKKILSLIVLSVLSNSIIAQQLKPVEILREHVDGIPHPSVSGNPATCTATANPATGTVNKNFMITGTVTYSIINRTDRTQNYNIDEYLGIVGYVFTHVRKTISLAVNQSINWSESLSDSEILAGGNYIDQASIQIAGDSTCFVIGQNTVTVR